MTPDDYTDPTKWMELPPQQFPQTDFDKWKPYVLHDSKSVKVEGGWCRKQTVVIHPASAGSLFIDKEFICCQHEPIDIPVKPKSPGESGFDLED
jgi:hypothetical protein